MKKNRSNFISTIPVHWNWKLLKLLYVEKKSSVVFMLHQKSPESAQFRFWLLCGLWSHHIEEFFAVTCSPPDILFGISGYTEGLIHFTKTQVKSCRRYLYFLHSADLIGLCNCNSLFSSVAFYRHININSFNYSNFKNPTDVFLGLLSYCVNTDRSAFLLYPKYWIVLMWLPRTIPHQLSLLIKSMFKFGNSSFGCFWIWCCPVCLIIGAVGAYWHSWVSWLPYFFFPENVPWCS